MMSQGKCVVEGLIDGVNQSYFEKTFLNNARVKHFKRYLEEREVIEIE